MKKEEKKVSKKAETTDKKVENKKVDVKKNNNKKVEKKLVDKKNVKKGKEKKENIFKRISKYFKGVFKEVKRIRWTTGKELVKYSIAAISFVIFFGVYFYAVKWLSVLIRDFDEIVEVIRSLVK